MNTLVTERTEHLFIVRVWQEPTQTAPAHWRGSIEHIPSAQRVYFESLQDLADFIAMRLGAQYLSENLNVVNGDKQ